MKVTAIQCPNCYDVIYSRARHDFHRCGCGEVAIDGGFDYINVNFKKKPPKKIEFDIGDVTRKELYDDWNGGVDYYGVVKEDEIKKIARLRAIMDTPKGVIKIAKIFASAMSGTKRDKGAT